MAKRTWRFHSRRSLALMALGALAAPGLCGTARAQAGSAPSAGAVRPVYLDPARPVAERVGDLVSRMTLEEKVLAAHERRGGRSRGSTCRPTTGGTRRSTAWIAGAIATVFPQAIGLAATFDAPLIHEIADVIADEARAKHHAVRGRQGKRGMLPGPDVLVAQHQHLPGPALGARPGDLRRGPVPDRRGWASPSSTGCRATTRDYLQGGRHAPSTSRSTAARSRSGHHFDAAASASTTSTRPTCRRSARLVRGAGRVRDGRLQPRQRRVGLRQPAPAATTSSAAEWGFDGLRGVGLRGDRRHPARPSFVATRRRPPRSRSSAAPTTTAAAGRRRCLPGSHRIGAVRVDTGRGYHPEAPLPRPL